ncbi:MAG: low molecular weight phosphotyrosine protein phosphatase, partial [Cyclobacteriaceae bacterium]|nr:low molecular weight phosphotyrosine protein phosphatase [Cyclobacteriaceae bacterium]
MKKKDKIKILFVCLGNICRSPLAKGIMQEKINKMGLKDYFHIDSCGTSDYHIGDSPDQRTTENAKNHGLLLTNSARQIEKTDLRFFDLILAMDQSNKKNIHKLDMTDEFEDKIHLMCDFSKNYKGQNVPDP